MKMRGENLLDSNIIIDLFRGDQKTIDWIKGINEVILPVIVIGELYFGAQKSNHTLRRLQEIERLEEIATILDITKSTARIYGEIKDQLRVKGLPIPENDIWIAAIAKEHNLILHTKDKHFENVDGISIEKW